ncbi:MAG: VWA domain-containing protein [Bryobacteraceae bacterium]|jgi:VWFA-related protein
MKYFALAAVCLLGIVLGSRAQGPVTQGSETVSKKKTTTTSTDPDAPAASTDATADPNAAPIPSKYKPNKDGLPQGGPTFRSDVLTVTLDVAVLDNHGNPVPKIPQEKFRILEDNTPQKVTGFSIGEAPMTICLVVEFSAKFQRLYTSGWAQTLNDAYYFVRTLKPEDYLAVIAYDLRPEILSDFSTDRTLAAQALSRLRIPAFSESTLYDTLVFTGERMQDIEGRKAIVLLSSGVDTISKLTYDKTRKAVQDNGIPIYAIGLLQTQREMAGSRGGMRGAQSDMNLTMANLQMTTFATETGGRAFFPRFEGEMPAVFQAVHDSLRNNYVLTYQPSNQAKDGKYRRLKVELVNEDNQPLKVLDEKGKPLKLQIMTKAGYKAPREVE